MCEHDAGAAGGDLGTAPGEHTPAPGVHAVVRRCVCSGTTFEEVVALLRGGLTLADVRDRTGAGAGCGACGPYLRLAQRSGRTAFAVLPAEVLRRLDQGA